jgi:hypothetical protein
MLAEALLYARARLSGQRNPHGHLTELVGIWARHRRQRHAWAGHLARARVLCLKAAEACESRRTALVLGAGLLLDVPLERLSALFERVVLADLAFLPGTIGLAHSLGNVELKVADLSACMDALPGNDALAAGARAPEADLSLGLADLDFAYSANLLSQLPLYALTALRKRHPAPPDEDAEAFAASMVGAHLRALCALPCPACLVTDTRERGLRGGEPKYEGDLLHGQGQLLRGETWTWRLAPRGEADPALDIERSVLGVADLRAGLHDDRLRQAEGAPHG